MVQHLVAYCTYMKTITLSVEGMHCASCSAIITKKITKLDGVSDTFVNFATEKATITFDPQKTSPEVMNKAITKLGYTLLTKEANDKKEGTQENDNQSRKEKKVQDLLTMKASVQFVLPITAIIFLLMMWDLAAKFFTSIPNVPIPMSLLNTLSLVLATIILFGAGQPFIQGVVRFARYRTANMDTLIGIGTLSAYLYSTIITLLPALRVRLLLPEYTYFDVTIVVIGFVLLGKYLEARSKARTGEAVEKLINLQVKTALVIRDGKEQEISIEEVLVGDHILIKPGEKIPVDGKIIEGKSSIDESMITGEAIPTDKAAGDTVIGAAINKQGALTIEATNVGSDTLLSQIIRMVEDAEGSRAPIQALADKISSIFVPTVLGIAFLSLVLWLTVGTSILGFSLALSYGILSFVGVLIIACPCALGLATPTAIIVGVGKGAEHGILIKDAESLETLSNVTTIVFDKTGTITEGKPVVTDIIPLDTQWDMKRILEVAASAEKFSEHPLAGAIINKAKKENIQLQEATHFSAQEGLGITASLGELHISIHRPNEEDRGREEIRTLEEEGKTVIIIEVDSVYVGIIALSDIIKKEAITVIEELHKKGMQVVLLTGDNHLAAQYIGKQIHADSVIAGVLPHEKAAKIEELQKQGEIVAMVGDGINDAPALARANVGIAMGTGTDIAIEAAGITLLGGDITKIIKAITLSKITMTGIRQNLFFAFMYNSIGIPLAAGLLYPLFGFILSPVFAGLAMALSSVSVVSNSLRIKTKRL